MSATMILSLSLIGLCLIIILGCALIIRRAHRQIERIARAQQARIQAELDAREEK